ncbi:MAG: methylmalonyl Co-A mutase-associated GTPase MeaB [Pseudomonadota bacterium]
MATDLQAPNAIEELAERLMAGERRALARAITLVESTRPEHQTQAAELFERIGSHGAVGPKAALRVGLSGTPGVGKSTFIEALGMQLVNQGLHVAVLAVDPSSTLSGGSILGDKTRMELLSRHPHAYIRPSPSRSELGGVARRTRETIRLVEAAGFDVVLVETVGVGQSETMVAEMTDIFTLLLAPAGGDELQGVKRGIMEIADLIVVNKADGDLAAIARATQSDYAGALQLMRRRDWDPDGYPKVLTASALTGAGLSEIWASIQELADWRKSEGWHQTRRAEQARLWLGRALERAAVEMVVTDPTVAATLPTLEQAVDAGELSPDTAVEQLLAKFRYQA